MTNNQTPNSKHQIITKHQTTNHQTVKRNWRLMIGDSVLGVYLVIGIWCLVIFGAGCAELRRTPPSKVSRPAGMGGVTPVGSEKSTAPATGVEREVVRLQPPQLASVRTPQRLASMQIVEQGKQQLSRREYDRALQSFQEAVTVDGSNGIAYYYLARIRYELTQYAEAMGVLERAESLLGDAPEWLENVAELRALIHEKRP